MITIDILKNIVRSILLLGMLLPMTYACSSNTTDCECSTKSKNSVTTTQFYDQEGDCSDLEDNPDMECTSIE